MQLYSDKRADTRVEFNGEIKYKVLSDSETATGSNYETALSKNISKGGLCILAGQKFSEGTVVRVEIPGIENKEHPIKAFCEVLWCSSDNGKKDQFEAGLSFIALKEDDMDVLQKYVTTHRMM
ncbi:MAG: PilZ domain-containing protein [Spirochaetia bacterium]|nr:PilZ domain-containing protein [Spirochaetia bacterium]